MNNTQRPAIADIYPVRDDAGHILGFVQRVDFTRSPWLAYVPGWYVLSHRMLESAENFVRVHATSGHLDHKCTMSCG